jgi:hypothetical protein
VRTRGYSKINNKKRGKEKWVNYKFKIKTNKMDANLKIFFCVKKKKEEIMIAWYYIAKMPGEVILV